MKSLYPRGMGMGWGHFPPPKPLLLTFEVTKKVYFCLCAKIESCYHELNNLNSTYWLTLGLDELENSRFLGEWGKLLPFLVVEFGSYLEVLFGVVLVVTQSLSLERSLGRLKTRKSSSQIFHITITSW